MIRSTALLPLPCQPLSVDDFSLHRLAFHRVDHLAAEHGTLRRLEFHRDVKPVQNPAASELIAVMYSIWTSCELINGATRRKPCACFENISSKLSGKCKAISATAARPKHCDSARTAPCELLLLRRCVKFSGVRPVRRRDFDEYDVDRFDRTIQHVRSELCHLLDVLGLLLVCPPWRQLDPDDWHLLSPLVGDCAGICRRCWHPCDCREW